MGVFVDPSRYEYAFAGVACTALVIASAAWAAAVSTQIRLNKGLDNPHGNICSSSKRCLAGRNVIALMQRARRRIPRWTRRWTQRRPSARATTARGTWAIPPPAKEEVPRRGHQEDGVQGRLQ